MDERMIDRTTTIKLALYYFDTYMRQAKTDKMDLFDIVRDLEAASAPEQGSFAAFSLPSPDR